MRFPQKVIYIIRRGDTLYKIAQRFNTTVSTILFHNPNLDPNNLPIGRRIIIFPNSACEGPGWDGKPPNNLQCEKRIELINAMRLVWSQHIYWTRMLLISIAARLDDQKNVGSRLLENPKDIADIFGKYYPQTAQRTISQLLTEHLQIGEALIIALRDGKTAEAEILNQRWYKNADQMARAFSKINPHYTYETLRDMLYGHLRLTSQEVNMRLAANYPADIEAFDEVERAAMEMADYFSHGIMEQFPGNF